MTTDEEMIAVMQAYVDGKQIQSRDKRLAEDEWWDNDCPTWDWERCEYRIKPEEEKPKRMTNRQLAEWCALVKGLVKYGTTGIVCYYHWFYEHEMDKEVLDKVFVMPKGTNEWVEPVLDIYERDCKGK